MMKSIKRDKAILLNVLLGLSLGLRCASFSSGAYRGSRHHSSLQVSIGLGPDKNKEENEEIELIPGVDYEVPNHEDYRTSRRTKLDETCDAWFASLLGSEDTRGVLGDVADGARAVLETPVPLVNEVELPYDDSEWTPYVATKLPWTPLVPAFGLEQFGLPVPRRNAEAWRQFDVAGMVSQDYSCLPKNYGSILELSDDQTADYRKSLKASGGWLDDDQCAARLVYIDGRFSPSLSMTSDQVFNMQSLQGMSEESIKFLQRLTDGFTDELAAPVPNGKDEFLRSFKKLSGPHHSLGLPFSQFAVNTQQGTACFAALNTFKTGAVAFAHIPKRCLLDKPVLVVNAITPHGGCEDESDNGVAIHPRCLVVVEEESKLSLIQSCVDLHVGETARPRLYNGFTQIFIKQDANVTHSYLEETGGLVVGGTEISDSEVLEGESIPREEESRRPAIKNTHLETLDVHQIGDSSSYEGTSISMGGNGRVRIAQSVSLLRPGSHASMSGFSLSGGAQRADFKTNIHHVAQGCTSRQIQKNMIGGRATGAFRGRIRVEQSAQQTDSEQLSRSILLSDRARTWAVPSLEIIADDVKCTHGTTVSDLSEEELFYLRSRGLDPTTSRSMLMYGFAGEVCEAVDSSLVDTDEEVGFRSRLSKRLENLVPMRERAIRGEFQSI